MSMKKSVNVFVLSLLFVFLLSSSVFGIDVIGPLSDFVGPIGNFFSNLLGSNEENVQGGFDVISSSQCPASRTLFRLSDLSNAHLARYDDDVYTYSGCYDSSLSNPSRACMSQPLVLVLSSVANAHVLSQVSSVQDFPVCYQGLACGVFSGSCSDDTSCVAKLSSPDNGHASSCSDSSYTYSLCCRKLAAGETFSPGEYVLDGGTETGSSRLQCPSLSGAVLSCDEGDICDVVRGQCIENTCEQIQCAQGQICNPEGGCVSSSRVVSCSLSSGCAQGQICSYFGLFDSGTQGLCVSGPGAQCGGTRCSAEQRCDVLIQQCVADLCLDDSRCVENQMICDPRGGCAPLGSVNTCSSSSDCSLTDQVCSFIDAQGQGVCVQGSVPPPPPPPPGFSCDEQSDCPVNTLCLGGSCSPCSADSDGDGSLDCNDSCPSHPNNDCNDSNRYGLPSCDELDGVDCSTGICGKGYGNRNTYDSLLCCVPIGNGDAVCTTEAYDTLLGQVTTRTEGDCKDSDGDSVGERKITLAKQNNQAFSQDERLALGLPSNFVSEGNTLIYFEECYPDLGGQRRDSPFFGLFGLSLLFFVLVFYYARSYRKI